MGTVSIQQGICHTATGEAPEWPCPRPRCSSAFTGSSAVFWNNLQVEIVLAFPWELFMHSFSFSLLSSSSPTNAEYPLTLKAKGHILTSYWKAGSTGRQLYDDVR